MDLTPWQSSISHEISNFQDDLRNSVNSNTDLQTHFYSKLESLEKIFVEYAGFYGNITIARSGTTDIVVPIPNARHANAPILPVDDPVRLASKVEMLAAQLYFFVRNLAHHHQH